MTDLEALGKPYTAAHEGNRLVPYDDATGEPVPAGGTVLGTLTVGKGHTGPDVVAGVPWTQQQVDDAFDRDWSAAFVEAQADISSDCWMAAGLARQVVFLDMAFQLGEGGLAKFTGMLGLFEQQRWDDAATDALNTKVGREEKNGRWGCHAAILRAGDAAIVNGALPT